MLILITNDCNYHEAVNPYAALVKFEKPIDLEELKKLEYNQLGATRTGGRLLELLEDATKSGFSSNIISQGRRSDYTLENVPEYRLISGNY